MGGRRNGLIRRSDDSDYDMDSSEDEAWEEMIDDFEYRLALEKIKRELLQELSRRKGAMKRFVRDLNENWNELMKPIPVSDSEDNEDGKGSTKEANNSNSSPSILSDDPEPKKKRFKKSTAFIMYEWAKNQPEYEEEKERYRQLKSNYCEETIAKLAFFKWSSKHNSEDRMKSKLYKEERQKEWDVMKKRKWEQMKAEDVEIFKKWSRCELERRNQEDKIKRKQEVQNLRQQYLADGDDGFFEIK